MEGRGGQFGHLMGSKLHMQGITSFANLQDRDLLIQKG